jgi:hypothetical protein
LARAASILNLGVGPQVDTSNLPIASRMTTTQRNQTTRVPPTPDILGHSRSLTISNPDPTSPRSPMGHIRSKTIDSPRSTEYSRENLPDYSLTGNPRPTRPRIVIPAPGQEEWNPRGQGDRYPPFRDKSKLQPPSAYPAQSTRSAPPVRSNSTRQNPALTAGSRQPEYAQANKDHTYTPEIIQTPNDLTGLSDIYDDYHSPTPIPDLVEDLPYTAIGQAFTGVSPIQPKPLSLPLQRVLTRSKSTVGLGRSDTNRSRRGNGQGLLLTVEDQVQSPVNIDQGLIKIRIKVSSYPYLDCLVLEVANDEGTYRKPY